MTHANTLVFKPLTGIYEPSGVLQLHDGRFLVIEDEEEHPFSLVTIAPDGSVSSNLLSPGRFKADDDFWKLDDLEGLSLDQSGYIYALTSHSRDSDGGNKKSRDKLVRFSLENDRVVSLSVSKKLKPALVAKHPVLAQAAKIQDVKNRGGFNIEALEVSADQKRLLIGFRSPLLDGRAIIASVENLSEIFEGAEPTISPRLETLDLAGNGIRGMSYIPSLNGYLVISGPVARQHLQFQLWFWSGKAGASARRVTAPGLPGFEHAEGVSPATVDGRQQIIVVSDDGNKKKGDFAHYLLLADHELRIAA